MSVSMIDGHIDEVRDPMREKLIELIRGSFNYHTAEKERWILDGKKTEAPRITGSIADHLLANGVIVMPCKIDDPIYVIRCEKEHRKKMQYRVDRCDIDHFTIGGTLIPMITACSEDNEWYELIDGTMEGHEYWLTREEAEAALKEGQE